MMKQTVDMWPNSVKVEPDMSFRMGGYYGLTLTFEEEHAGCKVVIHCEPSLFWYNHDLCREMKKVHDAGEEWFKEDHPHPTFAWGNYDI